MENIDVAFGKAFNQCRRFRELTQEDFGDVSSRTYISQIERGISAPTLKKIEALALKLELEPTTIVALCFLKLNPNQKMDQLLLKVSEELNSINLTK